MAKNKDTEKRKLRERLCHALDISPDVFPRETLIEIRGSNCLTLKGGGRITEYTDTRIRLKAKGKTVTVNGKRLCCSAYCKGAVTVDGLILSVDLGEEQ